MQALYASYLMFNISHSLVSHSMTAAFTQETAHKRPYIFGYPLFSFLNILDHAFPNALLIQALTSSSSSLSA